MGCPMSLWHLKCQILVLTFIVKSVVLSIMVPETFLQIYAEHRGDRRFITQELLEAGDSNRELFNAVPCIASFLDKYIVPPRRATLWLSDDLRNEFEASFLKNLHTTVPLYTLDNVPLKGAHRTASSAIILIKDSYSLDNTTAQLLHLCNPTCNFLIVLATAFGDEESFLDEVDAVVQLAWKDHSLSKVVVLGLVRDSVLLSGSTSFKPDEICTPSGVILLDRCANSVWNRFEGFRVLHVNRCIFNLGYLDQLPYSTLNNSSGKLIGIEGVMMEQMMPSINMGLNRVEISLDGTNSSASDVITVWLNNEEKVDLVIGGLICDPNDEVAYTTAYEGLQVVWMLPVTSNVSLRGLITPFHPYVWAVVVGILILGVFVRTFLIREITCLDMLALIIGVATARQPRRSSSRIQFISWAIYGFYLTQFYLLSLAQQLIYAARPQINTLEELAESNYVPAGYEVFNELLLDDEAQDGDIALKKIADKFVPFERNEYLERLADLFDGRNSTYALLVMFNVSHARPPLPSHVHLMEETMGTYPIALATWKGQPYLEKINARIQTFIEMGMIDFYSGYYTFNVSSVRKYEASTENSGELRIHHFVPAFLLMTIGFSIGFVFLVLEIIFYPSKWLD